jgi:ketosteroid isomerase-like protein
VRTSVRHWAQCCLTPSVSACNLPVLSQLFGRCRREWTQLTRRSRGKTRPCSERSALRRVDWPKWSGTFTSPQSVGEEVFPAVGEYFEEFTAESENYDDQGDTIVVTGRFKGKAKSGAELDANFEHVYRMEGGKIKRLENNVDQDAWTAAWS